MNRKLRVIAPLVAVAVLAAVSASAAEVAAGWDFSQYRGNNSLAPLGSTLPANYSDSDPTFNAGSGSATFGTLYFDGTNGSSSTSTAFLPTAGTMNCQRLPVGGPLKPSGCATPNVDGPIRSNKHEAWSDPGEVSFDAHSVLRSEGQQYQNLLAMTANDNVSVVFKADLGAGNTGSGWGVSFGGKTFTGTGDSGGPLSCDPAGASQCSTSIGIEHSTDGVSYASAGSVQLTSADARYQVAVGAGSSQAKYVRLNLAPGGGGAQPMIDNVAITLPEAGSTVMLLSGTLMILFLRRRSC